MKLTITIPLYSIYSLIQNMEEMANNPEIAKQYEDLLSALDMLKDTFMPLIEEFKDCLNMPDIDAMVDTDSDSGDSDIDWEQRRYELTKAAMQGRVSALDKNFNFDAMVRPIVKDSIKMADAIINELKEDRGYE